VTQGNSAQTLLDDPTLKKALETMQVSVQSLLWDFAVKQMGTTDDKKRLDSMAWAIENFRFCLDCMVSEGKLTEEEILRENKPAHHWASIKEVRYGK
jgi:hypothetical protein